MKNTRENGEGEKLEEKSKEEEETEETNARFNISCLKDLNRFATSRGQREEVYFRSSTCVH